MTILANKWNNPHKNISHSLQKCSSVQLPSIAEMLMLKIYLDVLPRVRKYLELWKKEAEQIPDYELGKLSL